MDIVGLAETGRYEEGHFNSSKSSMIVYGGSKQTEQRCSDLNKARNDKYDEIPRRQ